MSLPVKAALALLVFTAGACSSSTSTTSTTSTSAGAGGAGGAPGTTGVTGSGGAGGVDATSSAASSSTGAMAISDDCKQYCDCYAANCATLQSIPGGLSCPAFCAGFTPDQWTCRNAHGSLVVPEMNPSHCQHAVGIDQCL